MDLGELVYRTLTAGLPQDPAECERCMYRGMHQDPIVTYSHQGDPAGTRYLQLEEDTLPKWAVDVKPVQPHCCMFMELPKSKCMCFKE
jgi:hypothetical protein